MALAVVCAWLVLLPLCGAMSPPLLEVPEVTSLGAESVIQNHRGERGNPPVLPAAPFNVGDVHLHDDSFFGKAQAENTVYLQYLDVDRLLFNFRFVAGLDNKATLPYGGWIGNVGGCPAPPLPLTTTNL